MNTDFIVVTAAKSGTSVRLKAKNTQALRVENMHLEMQNQEMEQKLKQLLSSMSREKEERERSKGYHWKSGQAGNQSQDKENMIKVSSGRIKLKILKDSMPEPEMQKVDSKMANVMGPDRPKVKGKACGQCESKSALLMCLECGEDYCSACYAKIHQKGALKLHRTRPIQIRTQREVSQQSKERISDEPKDFDKDKPTSGGNTVSTGFTAFNEKQEVKNQIPKVAINRHASGGKESLLHGTFNEEESAKSFNDVLLEWRRGVQENQKKQCSLKAATDCTGNSESQTVMTVITKPFEVEFAENSLTYMEKLMLKKHRRTPMNRAGSQQQDKCECFPTSALEHELNESDCLTAEEMEDHEHCVALFKPEIHVKNDVSYNPALKIVELDKTPDAELEESTACLVFEDDYELNSQQSFTDKEIQNSQSVAKMSRTSPIQAGAKRPKTPLQSTFSIKGDKALRAYSASLHKEMTQDHLLTAPELKDSKSMEYKSFNENQSLDSASAGNVSKDLRSIALREKCVVTDYQGLNGFLVLDVDTKGVKLDHRSPQSPDPKTSDEKITCIGSNHWRPASSLSMCADEAVVQDILEKAQFQCNKRFTEKGFSPRQSNSKMKLKPVTGSHSVRAYSANSNSISRTSKSNNTPRPSSAAARPISRAASEISEIEYIDLTDKDDPLLERAEEQKVLAVLKKELDVLQIDSGMNESWHQGNSHSSLQFSPPGESLTHFSETYQTNHSMPVRTKGSLESHDEESYSDGGDDDALQDRLNVLSLQ
ncbi:zinc finger B-box domain-containing protein 1 [Xenopus laevis]|uniref:Zinc finger B-box domain-containing protein 1 n=2 Tax=Xenopus laevis TaxID=8355 RepID=A0A1L8GAF6_XENLA|nr:zinc finger B-box domain-containing protein 1 [Xenopus laevis]XP_018119228.1 zinc finger B-box domain-containing protein 1 [Xenopus laevis]OCT80813.1 hypothetical protein XELAEV_18027625mg [Xenopus laevis]